MFYTVIPDNVLFKFLDDNNIQGEERAFLIEKTRRENILHLSLNDRLTSNLKALEAFYPHLYARFKDYKFKNKVEFFIEESGTINFTYNGKILYDNVDTLSRNQALSFLNDSLISRVILKDLPDFFGQITYRYVNEAIHLFNKDLSPNFKSLSLKDYESIPMLFAFGLCSAFYFDTLYDNIDIKRALVFEPNEDYFFIALHFYDFNNLFNYIKDNGFYLDFCIGKDKDGMINCIQDYLHKNGVFVADVASIFIHTNTDVIEETIAELSKNYIALNLCHGFFDDSLFALSHSFYSVEHKYKFVKHNKKLNKDLLKTKIFIVANGPSLEHDIAFLRENQDKALIIACGSAIDSLYNSGIETDFIMVTERTPCVVDSFKHLINKSNYLDNVIVVGTDITHHSTLEPFKKHMLFIKAGEIFADIIDNKLTQYKDKFAYIYDMNPLVANFALSFALTLGFKDIYMFGCDFGKRIDAPVHFKDSFYYNHIENAKYRTRYDFNDEVLANFGGHVQTTQLYKGALLTFEQSIKTASYKFSITNCSDGAKIANTKAKHSSDLNFKNVKTLNKDVFKEIMLSTLCSNIDFNLDDFAKFIDKDGYKDFCSSLIHDLSFKAEDRLSYLDNLDAIFAKVQKTTFFNKVLLNGSVYYFLSLIVNTLYKDKDINISLSFANKVKDLFIYFLLDSIELVYLLPNYLMGEHRALINYKIGHDHGDSLSLSTNTIKFELDDDIEKKLQEVKSFTKRYK